MNPSHRHTIAPPGQAFAGRDGGSPPAGRAAELYDDWLLAETQASLALVAWYAASRRDKAGAYARYAAHTDAEEAAARRFAQRLRRAA